MSKQRATYMSYLLRLWCVPGEGAVWQASLEDPQTGERRGFASLDELFTFLRRQMGLTPEVGGEKRNETMRSEQGGI
jgi:hypothetical protein